MSGRPVTAKSGGLDAANSPSGAVGSRVALAGCFAVFVFTGWWGVDFGTHWDEHVIVSAWKQTVEQGTYAPPRFYPALYYVLSLPALGFAALDPGDSDALLEFVQSMPFRLVVRRWFVVLTALAVPITYWGVRRLRGRGAVDGLVAAAALAGCWQLSYHSRFIATDGLVVVLTPAATWLSLEALRRPARAGRLLIAAGMLAGLATAAKYPGGIGLLPALWVALRLQGGRPGWQPRLARTLAVAGAHAGAFVVGNTKVLLDTGGVWAEFVAQKGNYEQGHLGHSIAPGLEHAASIGVYLHHSLSPLPVLAWIVAGLALLGAMRLARLPREELWVFLMVPLVYLVYWSSLRVMIVRNLLLTLPYLMALVGLGAGHLLSSVGRPAARRVVAAGLVALFASNFADSLRAAHGIRGFETQHAVERLAREIEAKAGQSFAVTNQLASRMTAMGGEPQTSNWRPIDSRAPAAPGTRVAVLSAEFNVLTHWWPANSPGRYLDLDPRDVDWDYYPGWMASNRVVVMSADVYDQVRKARKAFSRPESRR